MDGYKHYIRIDINNIIIHGFSDAFEQPITNDIQLTGDFGRHFQIQLISPQPRSQFIYKLINGSMVARTQEELDVEWNSRPTPPPTQEDRLKATEDAILALMGL
jgi:hypothetical protein